MENQKHEWCFPYRIDSAQGNGSPWCQTLYNEQLFHVIFIDTMTSRVDSEETEAMWVLFFVIICFLF